MWLQIYTNTKLNGYTLLDFFLKYLLKVARASKMAFQTKRRDVNMEYDFSPIWTKWLSTPIPACSDLEVALRAGALSDQQINALPPMLCLLLSWTAITSSYPDYLRYCKSARHMLQKEQQNGVEF